MCFWVSFSTVCVGLRDDILELMVSGGSHPPELLLLFVFLLFVVVVGFFVISYDWVFFFQAKDGIQERGPSGGFGEVYKRKEWDETDMF